MVLTKEEEARARISQELLDKLNIVKDKTGISITWLISKAVLYAINNPLLVWGLRLSEKDDD